MKTLTKLLLILTVLFLVGCATRSGNSKKLEGYDNKMKSLTLIYTHNSFSDEPMLAEKLERNNFSKMGVYLSRVAPTVFSKYNIKSTVFLRSSPEETPPATNQLIMFISPTASTVTTVKNGHILQSRPVKVHFDVRIFDKQINKEVWLGDDFALVAGGLMYGSYSEEIAASFLEDILSKLNSDGLVEKIN